MTFIKSFGFLITFSLSSFLAIAQHEFVPNQLLVKMNAEVQPFLIERQPTNIFDIPELDSLGIHYGIYAVQPIGRQANTSTYLLSFSNITDIEMVITSFMNTNYFEFVEPNYIGYGGGRQGVDESKPNDTYFNRQYGLHNDGTFTNSPAKDDADLDMDLGWEIEKGDSSIIVAVLDAGAPFDHPELAGRLWYNAEEFLNTMDSDGNLYEDDVKGWDFVNVDNDPTDDHGHGTNVGGIIGTKANNDLGYAGVDWHCKLMICKILDANNRGQYAWWTDAIYYAVDNGAKVINMSVGGSGFSAAMQDAVNYAYARNVTIVACMMNYNNSVTYYPAGYINTIAVGATDASDKRVAPFFWSATSGSNFGYHIDVVAPGNYIYGLSHRSNTNYNSYWGGTSQSSPLVAGLASLLLAQDTSRTPDDIRKIIRETAEDQVGDLTEDKEGYDQYYGYGRVNAHQALLRYEMSAGIETNELSQSIVYPNPASDFLEMSNLKNFTKIEVINLEGKMMYQMSLNKAQQNTKIDIKNWTAGAYVVILRDENNEHSKSLRILVHR